MLTLPNYQIGTQIYESANSIVYRGIQKKDNQPVILKVLKEDYPTPEELTRYRQEYEITGNLNLDGVVKTYGIEKYQNTLVIILEDFGGESLKNILKPQSPEVSFEKGGLEEISKFLHLAIQVADTLGQIHVANIIHKDINPANIVFNQQTGQAKIIDFGISSRLPRENPVLKNPSQLEGTLAYISPEQTGRMNRSLDYRTDLYSLGVTFYELLTGQLPFSAKDTLELVHCHIAKPPVTVHELNPNISTTLSLIVMKLMAKNADERYQSAFGLKYDLEKCLENLTGLGYLSGLQQPQDCPGFDIAQHDFSGRFQIPQKLYGREKEIETLLQAFERVTAPSIEVTGKSEMILVAGYSGVGKSALVQEVHKPMTEKRGYFAAGKFDQYQRNIPYSALTQAFNAFCDYLLTESTEQLSKWRDKILTAAGPNGQVLIDVIPSLELVIGEQPAVAQVGPTEAQNRFNLVFQNFVKAISQPEHPLVLFIDDLQWADSASLNVLKTLLTDTDSRYLLIIGAYRDNEVDGAHPLMLLLQYLQKAQAIVNTLVLPNLSQKDVLTLIAETLNSDFDHVQTLNDLVYEKTQGNAFFTHEFLKSLYEQALLIFEAKTQQWQWDFEKIKVLEITDNVVELMAGKIGKLVPQTQAVLKLAACIGNQFDLKTLSTIYQQALSTTLEHLSQAMTELLVFPLDKRYLDEDKVELAKFKFQHDRVQQAAYSLIDAVDKQATHLAIGRLLLANTGTDDLEEHLFDIVNQFNEGISLVAEEAEKVKLVELNLKAGTKAKAATAYQPASNYFTYGIQLLGESAWTDYYIQAFELHKQQGECEFLLGHFEHSEQFLTLALEQAQSSFDRADILMIKIAQLAGQGKYHDAVATMIEGLNLFGMNVPTLDQTEAQQQAIASEMAIYQDNMKDRQIEDLYHLPMMQDEAMKNCSQMIAVAIVSVVIGLPHLLALYATKMVNMSIQYGLSPFTPVGYTYFSIIRSGGFKDYTGAYQFAALALRLNQNKLLDYNAKPTIYNTYGFFNILREHINISVEYFRDAYRIALESGDFGYAGYAMIEIPRYIIPISIGEGLKATLETITYCQKANNLPILQIAQMNEGFLQNLLGRTWNQTSFNVGDFREEIFLEAVETAAPLTCAVYKRYKLQSLSLFGDYEQALSLVHERATWIAAFGGFDLSLRTDYYLHAGITCAALYPNANEADKQTYLEILEECLAENQLLAEQCEANFQHAYLVLQAEQARIENRLIEAMRCYDDAIASAKKHGYLCNESLANELAAKFWLAQQKEDFARLYLKGAHYAYQQWGATAKVKQLEDQYPQWLGQTTTKNRFTDTQTTITHSTVIDQTIEPTVTLTPATLLAEKSSLDLSTVMKASQAISREIRLENLIKTFMQIVIENVGAEQGCLIMKGDKQKGKEEIALADELFLEAYATLDHVEILDSMPLSEVTAETDTGQCFSPAIITYTARKQEPQVLNDARHEGLFINDPHIVQRQPQSVLCFPIIYKNQVTGLFYLENNQTTGAFTSERLAVLRMLASQIAISLENAQYANHLEEKVKQRTAQLAAANEEITALNDMLKEENLRMSAELDVAKQLQQMVLPKQGELEQVEGLDIAGFMEPADEVGGDYYDVLVEDGRIKIGIGDVTGHGLESGVLMLMVQMGVQTLLTNEVTDPEAFLTVLNRAVYKNVQRIETDKNLTLSLLDYQPNSKIPPNLRFDKLNELSTDSIPSVENSSVAELVEAKSQGGILRVTGQHEDILLVRQNGEVELIDTFDLGFSVGLKADISPLVAQLELSLQPGDGIVLYTDGITEAQDLQEEQYGMERLCEVVSQNWHLTAKEIQQAVIADVRQYIDTQKVFDDITLLVLKQK